MNIKLIAEGGNMQPGPALSQKLGPAGIPINKVIQAVNEATKDFKGIKVPIELDVNPATKEFHVKVFSPPTAELLKKEFDIKKGSGDHKKMKVANASIEQIIFIAKQKMPNLLCKDLKSGVQAIVGSCVSLGILIENKLAKEVAQEIQEGKYDKEIKSEKTETSPDKKKLLEKYFADIKNAQDKLMKQAAAAKAAEEEQAKAKGAATPAVATAPVAKAAPAAKKK